MSSSRNPDVGRTFRSTSGVIAFFALGAFGLGVLAEAAFRAGLAEMLLLAPWVMAGVWAVYVLSAASMVRVDARGVVVQNYLRRTSFGWAQVRDVDLQWQLQFTVMDAQRKLTCWGGPSRGRPQRPRVAEGEAPQARVPAGYRELVDITDLWRNAGPDATAPIRRSWDLPAIIALGVLILWAIAAVLIAQR